MPLLNDLVYGQASDMQRLATRRALRRFMLVSSVVLMAAIGVAAWARLSRGELDQLTTKLNPIVTQNLFDVLEGRMWPEQQFSELVAPIPGWDTLIVLGPKARHADLGSLVDGAGFLVKERLGRLEGYASPTAPVRLVAISEGRWMVADLDLSWGTGYSEGTRLRREGWLLEQRTVPAWMARSALDSAATSVTP